MKVEKAIDIEAKPEDSLSTELRNLQKGQMLRLTTAREGRNYPSTGMRIAKERKIQFYTKYDGQDILVFIK